MLDFNLKWKFTCERVLVFVFVFFLALIALKRKICIAQINLGIFFLLWTVGVMNKYSYTSFDVCR